MYSLLLAPLFEGNIVHDVFVLIIVIIVAGLLIWALKTAITNFVPQPWQAKAVAFMYIVIALILATLLLRWAGLV